MNKIFSAAARIRTLETLSAGDSPLHRAHPLLKLLLTLGLIVAVLSAPLYTPRLLTPYVLLLALAFGCSGVPLKPLLLRLLLALPFPLLAGLSNVYFDRAAAFAIGGLTVSFGMLSLLTLLAKTLLCVAAVLLLIATTPFDALCAQLRRLHIPAALTTTLLLTYRYITLLLHEAGNTYIAYRLRAPQARGVALGHSGGLLGNLLLRCYGRAGRVYDAMRCRGFNGALYAVQPRPLQTRELCLLLGGLALLALLRVFDFSVLLGGALLK